MSYTLRIRDSESRTNRNRKLSHIQYVRTQSLLPGIEIAYRSLVIFTNCLKSIWANVVMNLLHKITTRT